MKHCILVFILSLSAFRSSAQVRQQHPEEHYLWLRSSNSGAIYYPVKNRFDLPARALNDSFQFNFIDSCFKVVNFTYSFNRKSSPEISDPKFIADDWLTKSVLKPYFGTALGDSTVRKLYDEPWKFMNGDRLFFDDIHVLGRDNRVRNAGSFIISITD